MALGQIDYFVLRPAVSPDELFHHSISSFLLDWTEARRIAPHTVRVVGEAWEGRAHELRGTLERCAIPHAFYLSDSRGDAASLPRPGVGRGSRSSFFPNGRVLVDPTDREIADATGASIDHEGEDFDVVIVGAGPAGLSAAVYSASEGLDTLVVDGGGIGGQATLEFADPQLPRIPARRQREAARSAGLRSGLGLRGELRLHASGDRTQ